jgi:FKBP-type peptidyl-prolyl cis-trans isomerase
MKSSKQPQQHMFEANSKHFTLVGSLSRRDAVMGILASTILTTTAAAFPAMAAAEGNVKTLPNGVTYVVDKEGSGPAPDPGELVAIRFRAFFGDNKIDDIFDTPEPYYTRVGSGGLF